MTDTPRDQEPDAAASDRGSGFDPSEPGTESIEPVTAPPAGPASYPDDEAAREGGAHGEAAREEAAEAARGEAARGEAAPGQGTRFQAGRAGARSTRPPWKGARRRLGLGPVVEPDPDSPAGHRLRRRRRWFLGGIAAGGAVIIVALCAGALGVVAALHGTRDRADNARQARALRNAACLELETRLNRLVPPGATTTPAARATAIQSENTAVRIYVGEIRTQRDQDAWRQLLDARTTYAEGLARPRTPAFYVAPRTGDGRALADELAGWSPAPCAGPIHRLAQPDL